MQIGKTVKVYTIPEPVKAPQITAPVKQPERVPVEVGK